MNNVCLIKSPNELLIDFSHEGELAYWSSILKTSPEKIKTAARACCSNNVNILLMYLNVQRHSQSIQYG